MTTKIIESLERMDAKALFYDFTFLRDTEEAKAIKKACLSQGWLPAIEWHDGFGCMVFHTMFKMYSDEFYKKNVAYDFENTIDSVTEESIESLICKSLEEKGIQFSRQVKCGCGIADIVTSEEIYEVKLNLNDNSMFSAIGQVLSYRSLINPNLKPVIIGQGTNPKLQPVCESLGIKLQTIYAK